MLNSKFEESQGNAIELFDMKYDTLENMMDYLHTDR